MSTICGDNWKRRAPAWRSTLSAASAISLPRRRDEPSDQVTAAAADYRARRPVLYRQLPGDWRIDLWRVIDRRLAGRPRAWTACRGLGPLCFTRGGWKGSPRAPRSAAG